MKHTETTNLQATDPKAYGTQIRWLRKEKGLSQKDLAKASGVPFTAIRRCEQKGQISLARYVVLIETCKASLRIEATPLRSDALRPNLLPYKTMTELIAAAETEAKDKPQKPRRTPQLGGTFDNPAFLRLA